MVAERNSPWVIKKEIDRLNDKVDRVNEKIDRLTVLEKEDRRLLRGYLKQIAESLGAIKSANTQALERRSETRRASGDEEGSANAASPEAYDKMLNTIQMQRRFLWFTTLSGLLLLILYLF